MCNLTNVEFGSGIPTRIGLVQVEQCSVSQSRALSNTTANGLSLRRTVPKKTSFS